MSPRITAFLIGLLSVTASSATVVAPADSTIITTGDSIVAAPPPPRSLAPLGTPSPAPPPPPPGAPRPPPEGAQNLLSLIETDTTDQTLPVIKMLRLLEYADSLKAAQGNNEMPVNPLFLPIVFKEQMSTPLQHISPPVNNPPTQKLLTHEPLGLQ